MIEEEAEQETPWSGLEGPRRLKPSMTRLGKFLGILFICVFWNGLSWAGFFSTLNQKNWFALAFMVPFVAIGLFVLFAALNAFAQLFNPRVSIALANGAPAAGEAVDLAWETEGRVTRLRELRISIIGEEVVTYDRGTTTATERKIFQRIEIVRANSQEQLRFGSTTVELPENLIHSFDAPRNKIVWSIEVYGDIPWWPDIQETMEFAVRPRAIDGDFK